VRDARTDRSIALNLVTLIFILNSMLVATLMGVITALNELRHDKKDIGCYIVAILLCGVVSILVLNVILNVMLTIAGVRH
jgi:hypothetical protein